MNANQKFIVAPHFLQFECEDAVFCGESETSLCYVSCPENGELIAAAMNYFKESGEMDKVIKSKSHKK